MPGLLLVSASQMVTWREGAWASWLWWCSRLVAWHSRGDTPGHTHCPPQAGSAGWRTAAGRHHRRGSPTPAGLPARCSHEGPQTRLGRSRNRGTRLKAGWSQTGSPGRGSEHRRVGMERVNGRRAQRRTELTCGTGAADTRGVAARGRGLAAGAASHQWHRLVAAVEVPEGDTGVEDVEDRDF